MSNRGKIKRSEDRKYHYIYKITRTDGSGKYYIGMHSTDDLEDGYFGSGHILSKSINKYGKLNHIKEILEIHDSRLILKIRESEIVNHECLSDPLCMNIMLGGQGGWGHLTEEQIKKRKENALIGSKERSIRSANTLKKRREDPEYDKKYRQILSDGRKKYLAKIASEKEFGILPKKYKQSSIKGRVYPEGHAARVSRNAGEKSASFGTMYVTKGIQSIRIKKEELEKYILEGWVKGRNLSPETKKFNITKDGKIKRATKFEMDTIYSKEGWVYKRPELN